MRLLGHMVTHNEAGRYLNDTLAWLAALCDDVAVFDDQSTDNTVTIAEQHAAVAVRHGGVPGLIGHEGRFRQAGWSFMEEALQPEIGDWVLCVDADEFPVGTEGHTEREALDANIEWADTNMIAGLAVPIAEVFDVSVDGKLMVRTDGQWGSITGNRLARWQPGGVFAAARLGGGSVPTYAKLRSAARWVSILHLGYARLADRAERAQRYSTYAGHSRRHVRSILRPPRLAVWGGRIPPVHVPR